MALKGFRQGYYTPVHPEKYMGNPDQIMYRSSWELAMNKFLDNNPHILRWSSEEIKIPYIKPTDGRQHFYFPDYWIEYVNKDGEIIQEIVEVKPLAQTKPPTTRGKKQSTILYEQTTWAVNVEKWRAAADWCGARGITFRVITEKGLFKT